MSCHFMSSLISKNLTNAWFSSLYHTNYCITAGGRKQSFVEVLPIQYVLIYARVGFLQIGFLFGFLFLTNWFLRRVGFLQPSLMPGSMHANIEVLATCMSISKYLLHACQYRSVCNMHAIIEVLATCMPISKSLLHACQYRSPCCMHANNEVLW